MTANIDSVSIAALLYNRAQQAATRAQLAYDEAQAAYRMAEATLHERLAELEATREALLAAMGGAR